MGLFDNWKKAGIEADIELYIRNQGMYPVHLIKDARAQAAIRLTAERLWATGSRPGTQTYDLSVMVAAGEVAPVLYEIAFGKPLNQS